jgi:prepilin-type N-terminal cleavage/methylation domain-containing protein
VTFNCPEKKIRAMNVARLGMAITAYPICTLRRIKKNVVTQKYRGRAGFSLMELLAVVTILGIIAAIIVPRVAVSSDTAKSKVNSHNKATIN